MRRKGMLPYHVRRPRRLLEIVSFLVMLVLVVSCGGTPATAPSSSEGAPTSAAATAAAPAGATAATMAAETSATTSTEASGQTSANSGAPVTLKIMHWNQMM